MLEEANIASIERKHMIREFGTTELLFDGMDLAFSVSELAEIRQLWVEGYTTIQIAKRLNRDKNEVFLAVFHLSFKNRKDRKDNIVMRVPQLRGDDDAGATG
ncbi:hypothetical protein FLK61_34210 [Paenalkalicoccus suaedae]|uniref:Uncharacterized protein n=1 Tax=Paenalkalicoccus suaedae TaxID=2592382 RepID=A0A859FFR8_9BACI|nr:hypothetical protein [Paenalkalicoccus suaedae]QKS71680.1 hypothetical protein FLK61_33915 [Paenalkalicoccus suaedae]QKS71733.1 hypothetical protein FLK61_34210 [Paenalkalicoccus suaedae]